jgi:hypothetical protein
MGSGFFISPEDRVAIQKFERLTEEDSLNKLLQVPIGHHYLVLYSELETMRKVYSSYVKGQMQEQPDSIILLLSYYDTTDNVRLTLGSKGIQVKEQEKNGSIIILDIMKVISNQSFAVPDIERLRALTKKLEKEYADKTIFIIADMSVFHHLKKATELLEYEKTLHKDLKVERMKELCFYNERDFNLMFTEEQANELLEYHRDRVIRV